MKIKNTIITIATAASLSLGVLAFAQQPAPTTPAVQPTTAVVSSKKNDMKKELETKKIENKAKVESVKKEIAVKKAEKNLKKEEMKKEITAKKAEIKKEVEAKKVDHKTKKTEYKKMMNDKKTASTTSN